MEFRGTTKPHLPVPIARKATDATPAIVADAGPAARFAWEEFFFGRIRNHQRVEPTAEPLTGF